MTLVRAQVLVAGRVQGVWFRETTRERACALGLTGWVRNLRDGRVEALFEGDRDRVEQALAFVRRGPPLARVSTTRVIDYQEIAQASSSKFRVAASSD